MKYEKMFGERPPGMPPARVFVVALIMEKDDYLPWEIDTACRKASAILIESGMHVRPLSEGIPC